MQSRVNRIIARVTTTSIGAVTFVLLSASAHSVDADPARGHLEVLVTRHDVRYAMQLPRESAAGCLNHAERG